LPIPLLGGDVVVPFGAVLAFAPFAMLHLPREAWASVALSFIGYLTALGVVWAVWLVFLRAGPALRVLVAPVGVVLCFGPLYWWWIFDRLAR